MISEGKGTVQSGRSTEGKDSINYEIEAVRDRNMTGMSRSH